MLVCSVQDTGLSSWIRIFFCNLGYVLNYSGNISNSWYLLHHMIKVLLVYCPDGSENFFFFHTGDFGCPKYHRSPCTSNLLQEALVNVHAITLCRFIWQYVEWLHSCQNFSHFLKWNTGSHHLGPGGIYIMVVYFYKWCVFERLKRRN